jgi:hypothetical protein
MGKIDHLGDWNEKSADFIHDLCRWFYIALKDGMLDNDGSTNNLWMLYFEAHKWQKTLKMDTATTIDEINELLHPGTKGR